MLRNWELTTNMPLRKKKVSTAYRHCWINIRKGVAPHCKTKERYLHRGRLSFSNHSQTYLIHFHSIEIWRFQCHNVFVSVDNPDERHATQAVQTVDHVWVRVVHRDAKQTPRVDPSREDLGQARQFFCKNPRNEL